MQRNMTNYTYIFIIITYILVFIINNEPFFPLRPAWTR